MRCVHADCAKQGEYIVASARQTLAEGYDARRMFCFRHAQTIFRAECTYQGMVYLVKVVAVHQPHHGAMVS